MKINFKNAAIAVVTSVLFSCSSNESEEIPTITIEKSSIIDNYASIVFANYSDAKADAENLKTIINTFTTNPTDVNFTAAKDAWLNARESYGQTEAFRFASGPIDR